MAKLSTVHLYLHKIRRTKLNNRKLLNIFLYIDAGKNRAF